MRLLVSVRDAVEADAAVDGGAEIVDAKEPAAGSLGAVAPAVLAAIRDTWRTGSPVMLVGVAVGTGLVTAIIMALRPADRETG